MVLIHSEKLKTFICLEVHSLREMQTTEGNKPLAIKFKKFISALGPLMSAKGYRKSLLLKEKL